MCTMMNTLLHGREKADMIDYIDGSIGKEDDPIIVRLRSQVRELTIGRAEIEKEYMNILSSMEEEKNEELNLMQAQKQATIDRNASIMISKESLIAKVANLEREASVRQKTLDEEKKHNSSLKLVNDTLVEKVDDLEIKVDAAQNSADEEKKSRNMKSVQSQQVNKIKNLKIALASSKADNNTMEATIQQLHKKRTEIKEKFGRSRSIERSRSVERSRPIERSRSVECKRSVEHIPIIAASIELSKMEDKFNEEVKRNNLLEEQIQTIVTREDTTNKFLAQTKLDAEESILQRNKITDTIREELDASKENVIRLKENMHSIEERDAVNFLLEEQKAATADLQVQFQQKEELIDQMTKVSDGRIEELKIELQQRNVKIKCIAKENEKNLACLKERETNFHLIVQKHQVKLMELDKLREKYEVELEHNDTFNEQAKGDATLRKIVLKHEARIQKQDSEIVLLKSKLTRANADEQEKLQENAILQESTLVDNERLRNHRLEIDELKKKLTNANMAKSDMDITYKKSLDKIAVKENNNDVEKDELEGLLEEVQKKCNALEGQLKEKEEGATRMQCEIAQMYKIFEEQTSAKRNEISELHGELLVKSGLLTTQNRNFEIYKFEVDKERLSYEANMNSLRAEIMVSENEYNVFIGINERNSELEHKLAESRKEIQCVHEKFSSRNRILKEPNGTVKILRSRNECLKNDVEKLVKRVSYVQRSKRSEI